MKPDRKSEATKYRGLIRDAKKGERSSRLIEKARRLKDPYFVSLALFDLSANPELDIEKAMPVAQEALKNAGRVEAQWRRAELLGMIAKKACSWRDEKARKYRERLLDGVLKCVGSMSEGKGLSDAIAKCVSSIGCKRFSVLLGHAVANRGFEAGDAKAVVRQWARDCKGAGMDIEDIMEELFKVEDAATRSKLLGYLHLQCKKSGVALGEASPLKGAVEASIEALEEERLEVLRYLAEQSSNKHEIEIVAGGASGLKEPARKARLMAALGTSADRAGEKGMALEFFNEGLRTCSSVKNAKEKGKIHLNLMQGLERCSGKKVDKMRKKEVNKTIKTTRKKEINHLLALYDTYEGGLKPVHVRAVARAAPLCAAFGLDLALMGFPTKNLEELVKMVASDTKIGEGGKYLKELLASDRVVLVPCSKSAPPENLDELGLPIATTSHPEKDKKVDMAKAMQLAGSMHPLKRACVIMGLGKRGLPDSLLEAAPYHLELTGSNVPLETATAMGIIASLMARKRF